ncbi:radical SAM family RiPP maturation amino acid epimerase [Acuticoccus kandeliae]|uniref:radical SAM family RiPP maturation amino acid epimerase n=1 Tax=Acuticoccus kandeliae TaxID=2073160 RepID=UPI000D3EA0F0|nr:radical SAM family RiPP maturation amino acid epimerase [Acuticoccus kandeliae]
MTITEATRHYRAMFDNRSPEELRDLAHLKRFMERMAGDPKFREALKENVDSPAGVTAALGIDIDPAEIMPLWRRSHLKYRGTEEADARWPKANAWDRWIKEMIAHRGLIRDTGNTRELHPRFDRWRTRQVARSMSELGGSADAIVHPVVAFELSDGCSVGCWFCGISADRFAGNFPYTPEHATLWQGVVGTMHDLFGTAVQTGFCYWATDPCDNPDYDRFIEDYYHITGALPQTTTAAPLKDPALTRRILALFDQYRTVTNRFSVLSVKHMDKIHAAFTPEELLGVELVLQNREALAAKANAGRARERILKLRAAGKPDKIATIEIDHTTIACVSGFLVSMPKRRIQLVSPVPGSERYPRGYRIFDERNFTDAASFRAAIESLIDEHMPTDVPGWWPARFREDLEYSPQDTGFLLRSRCMEHVVTNAACGKRVGGMLHEGDRTIREIVATLVDEGASMFTVADMLDTVYMSGLLEEPDRPGAITDATRERAEPVEA